MNQPLCLTWGNDHSLTITEQGAVITGLLHLKKKSGEQKIPVMFPPGIAIKDVALAWEQQKGFCIVHMLPGFDCGLRCGIRHSFYS